MRRRGLLALVAAAALPVGGVGSSSGSASTYAPSDRVTIFAFPTVHERAQVIGLLGSAEGAKLNDVVTIEARDCGKKQFNPAFEAHTDARGRWTLQIAPTITTQLRAVWRNARSRTVTVQDRPWVQLSSRPRTARGFGFEVGVRSERPFWKRHVVVQRLDRSVGRWRDLKKVVLTKTSAPPGSPYPWSTTTFATAVPPGTLVRAVLPLSQARPCYLAGYSNQLRAQS